MVRVLSWTVAVDLEPTRSIYAASRPDADVGGCGSCRSYASVRHAAIPPEARTLLESLGIDPTKENEVVGGWRLEPGLRYFGGWFHFAGRVLEGEVIPADAQGAPISLGHQPVTPHFTILVTGHRSLPCFEGFRGAPRVAVEFEARVPEDTPGFFLLDPEA